MKALTYKNWTENEEKLLKYYVEQELSRYDISIILNRTETSVSNRMKLRKIKYSKEYTKKLKSNNMSGSNNPMYGKETWIKGKTKENNEIIRNGAKKLSEKRKQLFKDGKLPSLCGENNPMYGKIPWSKGLTKQTDETIANSALKTSMIQKNNWKNLPDEIRKIRIAQSIKYLQIARSKQKNTDIEIIIKKYLEYFGLIENVDFYSNFYHKRYIFDFYLPAYNFVIECQGDYWHGNPEKFPIEKLNKIQLSNITRDTKKLQYLKENNFTYLFLWGSDIKNNFIYVKQQLENILQTKTPTLY